MKKMMLLCAALLFSAMWGKAATGDVAERAPRFELSGATYSLVKSGSSDMLGEVTFGYRITDLLSVSANGLMSNLRGDPASTWAGTVDLSVRPEVVSGLYLSPSVGLGVAGGKLGSERYDARMVVTAGVALRYDLTGYLFCGMEAKVIATTGVGLPLVGIRIGFRF